MSSEDFESTTESDSANVFLSYSRKDREQAQRISDALRAKHFGVFRDTDDILPTEEWRDRLQELIAEADTVVFLLSPNSATSEVCAWEVEHANSLNKRIAPIVIQDMPGDGIPAALARLNFIFCTDGDRFDDAVDTLVSALNTDIDWIREHTRVSRLAARWDETHRAGRMLLRGQDISDAEAWRDARPSDAPSVTTLQAMFVSASRRAAQRRQVQWLFGTLGVAAVTTALATMAYFQSIEAKTQRNDALAQKSRADAESIRARELLMHTLGAFADAAVKADQSDRAVRLALSAWPHAPSEDIEPPYKILVALTDGLSGLRRGKFDAPKGRIVAVSQNGERVLVSPHTTNPPARGLATPDERDGLTVWDIYKNEQVGEIEKKLVAFSKFGLSGDGRLIGSVDQNFHAKVWNVENGELLIELSNLLGEDSTKQEYVQVFGASLPKITPNEVAISPRADLIAFTTLNDEYLRVWRTADNTLKLRVPSQGSFSFVPNTQALAYIDGGSVFIVDLEASTILAKFSMNGVLAFCFSSDGEEVALLVQDENGAAATTLIVRNRRSGSELFRTSISGAFDQVSFLDRTRFLTAMSPAGETVLIDRDSGDEFVRQRVLVSPLSAGDTARLSPTGDYKLITRQSEAVELYWSQGIEHYARSVLRLERDEVVRITPAPSGAFVLIQREHHPWVIFDSVKGTSQVLQGSPYDAFAFRAVDDSLALLKDGRVWLSASPFSAMPLPTEIISPDSDALAFYRTNQKDRIVTSSEAENQIWDPSQSEPLTAKRGARLGGYLSLSIDSRFLVTGRLASLDDPGFMSIVDMFEDREVAAFDRADFFPGLLLGEPSLVLVPGETEIVAYPLAEGEPYTAMKPYRLELPIGQNFESIDVSSDGAYLLTTGDDPGFASLWHRESGTRIARLAHETGIGAHPRFLFEGQHILTATREQLPEGHDVLQVRASYIGHLLKGSAFDTACSLLANNDVSDLAPSTKFELEPICLNRSGR